MLNRLSSLQRPSSLVQMIQNCLFDLPQSLSTLPIPIRKVRICYSMSTAWLAALGVRGEVMTTGAMSIVKVLAA